MNPLQAVAAGIQVHQALMERDAAVRKEERRQVAQEIEAAMPEHSGSMRPHASASDCVRCGMERAARIARGQQ